IRMGGDELGKHYHGKRFSASLCMPYNTTFSASGVGFPGDFLERVLYRKVLLVARDLLYTVIVEREVEHDVQQPGRIAKAKQQFILFGDGLVFFFEVLKKYPDILKSLPE